MQQTFYDFRNVDNSASVNNLVQLFKQGAYIDGVFQKVNSQKFIAQLYQYLQGQTGTPKRQALKDIILMHDLKIIGLLSSSSQLFQFFQKIGLTVDTKKPASQKGKNYFSNDKEGWGNKFVNLVLEIVVYLGTKFSTTSKSEPTRFRKVLMKFQSEGVTLPTQPTYLPKLKPSSRQPDPRPLTSQPPKPTSTLTPNPTQSQPQQINPSSIQSLLQFYKDKIDIYFQQVQQAQDVDQTRRIMIENHDKFTQYLVKIEPIGVSLQNGVPGKSQQQVARLFDLYFGVYGFFQAEKQAFQKYCTKNHYDLYYDEITIKYEEIFPENKDKGNIKKKQSIDATKSKIAAENNKISQGNVQQRQKPVDKQKDNAPMPIASTMARNSSINGDKLQKVPPVKGDQQNTKYMIRSLMQKLEDKPVSPYKGFSQIRRSLQKQKSLIHIRPPNRYSKSPQPTQNASLIRSKISPIFTSPPNLSPPPKSYPGPQLQPSSLHQSILYSIPSSQSSHRFQKSLLSNKSVLYQSQVLQIGIKSQVIYQDCEDLDYVIGIELYFGNKGKEDVRGVEVRFQGGEDQFVLYTFPREIPSYVGAGTQSKYELMLVPKCLNFGFLKMRLSYSPPSGSQTRTTLILPTSPLKLSIPQQISYPSFTSTFSSLPSYLHTRPLKLSKYLPPQKLRKYFNHCIQLTKYADFCVDGSTKDYQLGYMVEMCNLYEMYVKVCIRPNLEFVVVVGWEGEGEEIRGLARGYAEGLRLALMRNQ